MKKTILASAIAAATFSGAALAQESNLPTVYGNIQYAATHTNVEDGISEVAHFDNGSTLGIKHSHEIAPGVTGFFKAEMEFQADDKATSSGLSKLDEAYIGIKGDSFGQVWVGSDDSRYEAAIDEISNYFEALGSGTKIGHDTGEGDLIQYSSPNFAGLQLHGAVQINGDGDKGAAEKSYPYQVAVTYALDSLELAVAADSNDGDYAYSNGAFGTSVNNENTYGVRASYAAGDLRVTGSYQTRKDVGDAWGLFAGYSVGANTFAVAYGFQDADNTDDEVSTLTLQALHNLSDHMYVYVEGGLENKDDGSNDVDTTTLAVGATYYF
ncbi:porin [Marinobacter fuscus]|uniref:Porin n=1 Tax=Marinobacter fuscus TaxID=2109942 RepID=A0A2T1K638_9GAMM|nr:porin [Marinobacter fuscus]PSF05535.1 porin [Marinobacter fuscus]